MSSDCPMSMSEALQMPLSFESIYYGSSAWKVKKTEIESNHKASQAVAVRLNRIISLLGGRA